MLLACSQCCEEQLLPLCQLPTEELTNVHQGNTICLATNKGRGRGSGGILGQAVLENLGLLEGPRTEMVQNHLVSLESTGEVG